MHACIKYVKFFIYKLYLNKVFFKKSRVEWQKEITFNISVNPSAQWWPFLFPFSIFSLTKNSWAAIDGKTQQSTTL
jgi:hypothetical protein